MVSNLSVAPAISFSVGSSGVSGIGGHQDSSAKVASASRCLVLHPRRDLRLRPLPCWCKDEVGAPEPVADELNGRRPWCLVADELGPGSRCGKRTTGGASDIHPQHIHIGAPYRWNRGRTRWL